MLYRLPRAALDFDDAPALPAAVGAALLARLRAGAPRAALAACARNAACQANAHQCAISVADSAHSGGAVQ